MTNTKKKRETKDNLKIAGAVVVGVLVLRQRKDLKSLKRAFNDLAKAVDYNAQSLDLVGRSVDDHRNYLNWLDEAVAKPFTAKAVKKGLKAA